MSDLRDHLFETLERLKDEDKPMDIERAKAISQVAQTVIESAKVEVKYLELAGDGETKFFDAAPAQLESGGPVNGSGKRLEARHGG